MIPKIHFVLVLGDVCPQRRELLDAFQNFEKTCLGSCSQIHSRIHPAPLSETNSKPLVHELVLYNQNELALFNQIIKKYFWKDIFRLVHNVAIRLGQGRYFSEF